MVSATYFDGQSARAQQVTLRATAGRLHLLGEGIDRQLPLAEIILAERLGSAPRRLDFKSGGHCEVRDHAGFESLMRAAGFESRWIERAQRSLPIVLASLVAMLLLAGGFYQWGLPIITRAGAERVTPELAELLASNTLELLDDRYLTPSRLDAARQQQLKAQAETLRAGSADAGELLFRSSSRFGANALTLPDGRIVVLDELVALADHDDQVLAVIAHERGHAAGRHGLHLLIHGTVVGGLAAWWFGDVSQLLVLGPTLLLNTQYSRQLEEEADHYAVTLLQAKGIDPVRLAEMLRKLSVAHAVDKAEKKDSKTNLLRHLSTHPDTEARIARIRQAALPRPAADERREAPNK